MKLHISFALLASCLHVVMLQQCRQVTMCDDETLPPRRAEGDKGDVGSPGKSGPPGAKGAKGEVGNGEKGMQGESCGLGDFESEVRRKFAELDSRLNPTSCLTSTFHGRQLLAAGEEAYCDGGWTVIQRRFDGSIDFQRNWEEYQQGFGDLNGEFWLGLDNIHNLTRDRGCRLRIDLWDFGNDHAFAQYSSFSVEDESDLYRLHVGGYSGTAGDSLTGDHLHNDMPFTTKDRDNDNWGPKNCAFHDGGYHGGWWFNACYRSLLNGPWGPQVGSWRNIIWKNWKGADQPIKKTTMKLRCD